jgi:hypothetical protein
MRTLAVLAIASLLLGGCASSKPEPGTDGLPAADFKDLDLAATATTGIIRGIVVDEAIRPVGGVLLVVQTEGGPRETKSADDGVFGFDDLTAGTYFVQASKLGYTSAQTSTDVVAGVAEPAIVKVLMTRDPGTSPFFEAYTWEGFIDCSARYFVEGRNFCSLAGDLSNDDTLYDIELTSGTPTYAQGELVWESTQSLGDELSFNWRKDDTNTDYVDIEGPSPLVLAAEKDLLAENEVGAGQPLRTIIFTAHNSATEPPGGLLWGVGVQWQQRFTVYIHVFYNFHPPEGWQFSVDGEPVPPA